jgi:hypothetical protein
MTPPWKKKSTAPQIRDVRLLFGGRAAYVQLFGSQERIESATLYQEVADKLTQAGITAFLLDIREATYPPSQVAEIAARAEWLGRTYPQGRAVLWYKGQDPYTVSQLVKALQRCGHEAMGTLNAMAARRFLVPREEPDTWLIDDNPPGGGHALTG